MPYHYESGVSTLNTAMQMGAAYVNSAPGNVRVRVVADGHVALDVNQTKTAEYRLPMWVYANEYQYILSGTAQVRVVAIAPSMKDL